MVERASPVIRETTASPPPAGRSPLARREHPPPAFVKLRADHVPAIANRIFIDHAIRDTSVRLDPESRRPESTRRTPAHRDSLIVRGGLSVGHIFPTPYVPGFEAGGRDKGAVVSKSA